MLQFHKQLCKGDTGAVVVPYWPCLDLCSYSGAESVTPALGSFGQAVLALYSFLCCHYSPFVCVGSS